MSDDARWTVRSEHDRGLLDVVRRYEPSYNADVAVLVHAAYACDVDLYMTGGEQFLAVGKAILTAAPKRRMRVDRAHICDGQTGVVEAVILGDARLDFFSPFCAPLTIRDGRIVEDRSDLDPAQWPGIIAPAPFASPGGLGRVHLNPRRSESACP